MITQEELQAIRERADRATPPPWMLHREFNVIALKNLRNVAACGGHSENRNQDEVENQNIANAIFVCGARQDIPALLAEIERLQEEVERLQTEVKYLNRELEVWTK